MAQAGSGSGKKRMSAASRREQILDAAREVFIDAGYAGARTQDIAAAAGVNSALVFRHFESKEEIFKAAVVDPLKQIMAETMDSSPMPSTKEQMTQTKRDHTVISIAQMIKALTTAAPLLGVVLFADRQGGSNFWEEHISPLFQLGGTKVRQGLGTWSHRSFDPEFTTKLVFGMCLGLAMDSYFTGSAVDPAEAAAQVTDLLIDGLRER